MCNCANYVRSDEDMSTKKDALSSEYKVNSQEWWEGYFGGGLWSYYDGGAQTLFFAKVAWEHINQEFIDIIMREQLKICDVGCAEGEGVYLMTCKFPRNKIFGIDLSEYAVKNAVKKYPMCCFICSDLDEMKESCDVLFSSNVLEHLVEPERVLQKLYEKSNRYIIIMVPFKDDSGEISHINKFGREFFYENCPRGVK